MPDSVVPTPSEKPMCEHGNTEGHPDWTVPLDADDDPIWCLGPVISTEPETPVPDAMCEVHLEKDGRLRISVRVRPDQMYATLSALQSTPELRERVKALRPPKDRFLSAYEEGRRDAIYEVLDVLGEPK